MKAVIVGGGIAGPAVGPLASLVTKKVKVVCPPWVNVPPSGVFERSRLGWRGVAQSLPPANVTCSH